MPERIWAWFFHIVLISNGVYTLPSGSTLAYQWLLPRGLPMCVPARRNWTSVQWLGIPLPRLKAKVFFCCPCIQGTLIPGQPFAPKGKIGLRGALSRDRQKKKERTRHTWDASECCVWVFSSVPTLAFFAVFSTSWAHVFQVQVTLKYTWWLLSCPSWLASYELFFLRLIPNLTIDKDALWKRLIGADASEGLNPEWQKVKIIRRRKVCVCVI